MMVSHLGSSLRIWVWTSWGGPPRGSWERLRNSFSTFSERSAWFSAAFKRAPAAGGVPAGAISALQADCS
ncbi:hypothetical protein G6F57_023607 [Rhizopus arrhizus]|nr:hypothetical protein G6F57_023607 [Rhizopus arrhizus]